MTDRFGRLKVLMRAGRAYDLHRLCVPAAAWQLRSDESLDGSDLVSSRARICGFLHGVFHVRDGSVGAGKSWKGHRSVSASLDSLPMEWRLVPPNCGHYWIFSGFFLVSGCCQRSASSSQPSWSKEQVGKVQDETGFNIFRKVTFSRRNLIILPGAFVFGFAIASFTTFGAPILFPTAP